MQNAKLKMKNCGAQPLLTFAFYIFNFAFLLSFLPLVRYDACWEVSALFAGRFFLSFRQGAALSAKASKSMTGQLDEHPLAELIREISVLNLSGALRLFCERAKMVLYFDSGEIIYAASNLRAFHLQECVRRWGVLTNEQLARVQSKTSDPEFGEGLVDAGMLSRDVLDELITRQVSEMLCHSLLWIGGDWDYDPRV